ncbi:MAG: hypothetical protein ACNA7X_04305 [Dehalococcoidia bacterium]
MPSLFDTLGRPKVAEAFGGDAFCHVNPASGSGSRQFYPTPLKLRDAVFYVHTHNQLLGDSATQQFRVDVGEYVELRNVDISTIYCRNVSTFNNGTVVVLGTRE